MESACRHDIVSYYGIILYDIIAWCSRISYVVVSCVLSCCFMFCDVLFLLKLVCYICIMLGGLLGVLGRPCCPGPKAPWGRFHGILGSARLAHGCMKANHSLTSSGCLKYRRTKTNAVQIRDIKAYRCARFSAVTSPWLVCIASSSWVSSSKTMQPVPCGCIRRLRSQRQTRAQKKANTQAKAPTPLTPQHGLCCLWVLTP